MAFNFTDPNLQGVVPFKRAHTQELLNGYENIKINTKFNPAVTETCRTDSVTSNAPKKVSLDDLRAYVNVLETKFSNNCDCVDVIDCCQSCQGCQTCQAQCTCQTTKCQSCQANCDCDCPTDCSSH